jgi:hypothetical protein
LTGGADDNEPCDASDEVQGEDDGEHRRQQQRRRMAQGERNFSRVHRDDEAGHGGHADKRDPVAPKPHPQALSRETLAPPGGGWFRCQSESRSIRADRRASRRSPTPSTPGAAPYCQRRDAHEREAQLPWDLSDGSEISCRGRSGG